MIATGDMAVFFKPTWEVEKMGDKDMGLRGHPLPHAKRLYDPVRCCKYKSGKYHDVYSSPGHKLIIGLPSQGSKKNVFVSIHFYSVIESVQCSIFTFALYCRCFRVSALVLTSNSKLLNY